MIYYKSGSENGVITPADLKNAVWSALDKLGRRKKVLAIPPDCTRFHSKAGEITSLIYEYYSENLIDILPALGTHAPMSENETDRMYAGIPYRLFRTHDWRNDVVTAGTVPGEFVEKITDGKLNYSWPAQLNKLVMNGGHDLIISIGQVVPHEVVGMANFNKNLFIGTGGHEGINKSHFVGAVYGMERIMGKADTPVRRLLDYASENFIRNLPVVYILTVIGRNDEGNLVMRGLFIGDDREAFSLAARLSAKVNFIVTGTPLEKVVVYLDPSEYKSTWLGNKSIYRTRMAMADNGELIVLAPGLKVFGEDREIDRLIRKYGYRGTPSILDAVKNDPELSGNLSAAAHLIHGSTEGRFSVQYCTGMLTGNEIESVGFRYASIDEMTKQYDPAKMKDGFNLLPSGEKIYYISNPATGLWASKEILV